LSIAEDTSTEYVIEDSIPVTKSRKMPTLIEQSRGPTDGAGTEGTDQELNGSRRSGAVGESDGKEELELV